MNYLTFNKEPRDTYKYGFLVPKINADDILRYYIDPYLSNSINDVIIYDLHKGPKRTPVSEQKEYLNDVLNVFIDFDVEYIIVSDAEYFKTLTKAKSVDTGLGYVLDAVVGDFKVIYVPNYSQIFYDPDKVKRNIDLGMNALLSHSLGLYSDPGQSIIKTEYYPKTVDDIASALDKLIDIDCDLTCDIEGFSLKHFDSGLGSITFCWNKHEGISFPIDVREPYGPLQEGQHLERFKNEEVRGLLINFFSRFKKKMIYHSITFDVYILVYQLYMDHLLDQKGLLNGLNILLRDFDCTKLITYLATNSCAGNKLGLKIQAQEFAGNYAVDDIKDITKLSMDSLLRYNLVDGISTWFVHEKHYQTIIDDEQEEIYENLFKDAVVDIIQMQLTGLPVDMEAVHKADIELNAIADAAKVKMNQSTSIKGFTHFLKQRWMDKKHSEWKVKRITFNEIPNNKKTVFNPNSDKQLQILLYDENFMNLPVLDRTDTKQPSTGKDTLEKLKNHTTNEDYLNFLDGLISFKEVIIILSTFIPALKNAQLAPDGWHYMFGNFNLGGTLSGRLSSNKPNLQNIPSTSIFAKIIKMCIKAPKGWLFVGLDFSSLEDRISGLTTKDPMKLKVYTDGYDGHSLRAYSYYTHLMPDINPDSVESINSIAEKYKPLRQESKPPTFALTYDGTYITLMANCGFSEEKAKLIESRFKEMYKVSIGWVQDRLQEATKTGYITCAFGLRVRTPLLKQVILGTRSTPFEASAEGRSAGNALGQSWCLLNSRAASAFMKRVRNDKFRLTIKPCAHIHDAQYYLIRDDMDHVLYLNEHLVHEVYWQDHPDIAHPDVGLGGELSIFYPNWACEMVIPNEANEDEITKLAFKHYEKYG